MIFASKYVDLGGAIMAWKWAAAAAAITVAAGASAQTDLAAAFGARPQLQNVSLSPDGTKLAYVVPTSGQGSALLTLTPGKDVKPSVALVASGEPERLRDCRWVSNDRLVCTLWGLVEESIGMLPFGRIFAVDADGGNVRALSKRTTIHSRGQALGGGEVIDWLPEEDGMVLMARLQLADDRLGTRLGSSQEGLIVEKLNTRNLSASRVESIRENAYNYITDGHGTPRIMGVEQIEANRNTGVTRYYYRTVGAREWLPLGDHNYVADTGFRPVAVDHKLNAAYGFRKKNGLDAVYRVYLDGSNREEEVFSRPDVDVDDLVYIGRSKRVIGATFVTDVRETVYFDADLAKLRSSLAKALPNQPKVEIVEASGDEKKLLIRADSDNDPGLYYILDRTTREMAIFQPVRPQLEGVTLAKVQPISYQARDGATIAGYLTLPPGGTGKNLPAIVMPHGGPSARDEWGFDWLAQYFALRGFAVIQPNFRGSSGTGGGGWSDNGFRQWRTAIGDITDAGRWLIQQGIADRAKLAIAGWSYGGFAALQSAAVDPDLFKAVIAIAPVTDLPALAEQQKYWTSYRLSRAFIGTGPEAAEGSPTRNAARIKVPVLLMHGTFDVNVEIGQSRMMADRLRDANVPHQLVLFEGRDHYLEDSEVRARLLRESDAFLRKSMGM